MFLHVPACFLVILLELLVNSMHYSACTLCACLCGYSLLRCISLHFVRELALCFNNFVSDKKKDNKMNQFSLGKYKALIFDLDGTLVDSSESILEVLAVWCEMHQLNIDTVVQASHGERIVDFLPKVAPHLDFDKEVKNLAKLEAEITTGLVEISGAKQFLAQLNELNITWAIATGCVKTIAELRLKHCGLVIPEVFITSELVNKGKPSPEPFLLTASRLSIDSQDCLVFEDSDAGIQSAIAAGCDVVAVGQSSTIQDSRIVARVNDYHELVELTQLQEAI